MNFDSDFLDAEIYVNNQATGVKVQDVKMFGLFNVSTKVYAKTNKNGKDLVSDEYAVDDSENTEVYLDFENAIYQIERMEETIRELVEGYAEVLCTAVNYNDFSYLESYLYPGSSIYEMQKTYVHNTYSKGIREYIMSLDILSYNMSLDNKTGTVTTEERYKIYNADNEESIKIFKYTYTFRFNELNQRYQIESINQAN
ncbi:hypothetical protein FDN13_09855 [Caloramator sp. E03]|uniref:TcaA NTF2-like domain-containing protein n=1 Tax=Caloramator sp. E03 TaxID=2576307 RepID=UPI00111038ED|nr:hypothetical protein [Caloramator sp. E03]QCX33984.1 hypothetical protein FDN13_09855 [Caloramator sp. E03]